MISLPNGVLVPTGSDIVDPEELLGEIARSFSDAIGGLGVGKRQPRTFHVADQAAKAALAGVTILHDGDQAFVADTGWYEMWNGTTSQWFVWRTTRGVTWPFAHTGISTGNGTSAFVYHLDGDLVTLTGSFTFGPSSSVSSSTGLLALPFPIAQNGSITPIYAMGSCSATSGTTSFHQGIILPSGQNFAQIHFYAGSAGGALSSMSATSPRTWGNTDRLGFTIRWRRAL